MEKSTGTIIAERMAADSVFERFRQALDVDDRATLDTLLVSTGTDRAAMVGALQSSAQDRALLTLLIHQEQRLERLEILVQNLALRYLEPTTERQSIPSARVMA